MPSPQQQAINYARQHLQDVALHEFECAIAQNNLSQAAFVLWVVTGNSEHSDALWS